jgi:hypothetical protein
MLVNKYNIEHLTKSSSDKTAGFFVGRLLGAFVMT